MNLNISNNRKRINAALRQRRKDSAFVSVGKDMNQATETYAITNQKLSALKDQGLIKDYASASQFLISPQEQQLRLKRWKDYWTDEKQQQIREQLETAAAEYRFRPGSFDPFYQWLNQPFGEYHYTAQEDDISGKLLNEWQTSADSITMLISQIRISDQNKETVYQNFSKAQDVVIFDRSYFANKWVSAINDDFYLILYISSFLIFFALWFSYGRIELTLMSFLPMLVSWVIILGLMGILGIEFNIINIILSTFIFGIGDDFSIFIMDGLQNKYRTGQKVLNSHKTAIFFSAFTTVVGMGALVLPSIRLCNPFH